MLEACTLNSIEFGSQIASKRIATAHFTLMAEVPGLPSYETIEVAVRFMAGPAEADLQGKARAALGHLIRSALAGIEAG